jgi:8-oxo-dGTP pyrophosphatase MutT (NUDIX family)
MNTHVSAGLLMVYEGSALFLRRAEGDGRWGLPGGGIVGAETLTEGLARELMEETGLTMPGEPHAIWRMLSHRDGADHDSDYTVFQLDVAERMIPTLDFEHDDWVWRPLADPPEPLHPSIREMLATLKESA